MDMDPHYGSICGFRGMDLNPDSVTSLCVANDNWFTFRESMPDQKTDAVPVEWFALYNLLPDQTGDFDKALTRMNEDGNSEGSTGVWEDVDDSDDASETATGTDEAEESEEPVDDEAEESEQQDDEDESHTLYKAARSDSRDIRHVIDNHTSYTQDNRLGPSLFSAIGGEYDTEGPLIIGVKPA
ncbi:hypothetical protein EDB80DRAFT_690811 [Ilyonectria destructans]|nr:hypothetical protein EDB80DRAFT_690811 [Ilyonectria destructans]